MQQLTHLTGRQVVAAHRAWRRKKKPCHVGSLSTGARFELKTGVRRFGISRPRIRVPCMSATCAALHQQVCTACAVEQVEQVEQAGGIPDRPALFASEPMKRPNLWSLTINTMFLMWGFVRLQGQVTLGETKIAAPVCFGRVWHLEEAVQRMQFDTIHTMACLLLTTLYRGQPKVRGQSSICYNPPC